MRLSSTQADLLRAIATGSHSVPKRLSRSLAVLKKRRMVKVVVRGYPGGPLYWLTDKGVRWVRDDLESRVQEKSGG